MKSIYFLLFVLGFLSSWRNKKNLKKNRRKGSGSAVLTRGTRIRTIPGSDYSVQQRRRIPSPLPTKFPFSSSLITHTDSLFTEKTPLFFYPLERANTRSLFISHYKRPRRIFQIFREPPLQNGWPGKHQLAFRLWLNWRYNCPRWQLHCPCFRVQLASAGPKWFFECQVLKSFTIAFSSVDTICNFALYHWLVVRVLSVVFILMLLLWNFWVHAMPDCFALINLWAFCIHIGFLLLKWYRLQIHVRNVLLSFIWFTIITNCCNFPQILVELDPWMQLVLPFKVNKFVIWVLICILFAWPGYLQPLSVINFFPYFVLSIWILSFADRRLV